MHHDRDLYTYVGNDPLDRTDPSGNEGEFAALGMVLATAGIDAEIPDPSDAAAPGKVAVYGAAIVGTAIGGAIVWTYDKLTEGKGDNAMAAKEHTKGARPSTQDDHERGNARRDRDRGGEKGDKRRDPPGTRLIGIMWG